MSNQTFEEIDALSAFEEESANDRKFEKWLEDRGF